MNKTKLLTFPVISGNRWQRRWQSIHRKARLLAIQIKTQLEISEKLGRPLYQIPD